MVANNDYLYKPSIRFNGCGLLAEDNNYDDPDNDLGYIIPSKEFDSFEEFNNHLKVSYYKDYDIIVLDGDTNICFDKSYYLGIYPIGLVIIFILFLYFL